MSARHDQSMQTVVATLLLTLQVVASHPWL